MAWSADKPRRREPIIARAMAIGLVAVLAALAHSMVERVAVTRDDARAFRDLDRQRAERDGTAATRTEPERALPDTDEPPDEPPDEPDRVTERDPTPDGGTPDGADDHQATETDAGSLPFPADGRLTLEQGRMHYDAGTLFIDARRREDFLAGRVAGALWMPSDRLSSGRGVHLLDFFAPEDPIVIYCTGGGCDASENAAIQLELRGYTNLLIMKAGYDDWLNAGYPTDDGPDAFSEVGQ